MTGSIVLDTTYIILLILAIVYVPIYIWVWRSPKAKEYGLVKYGPCVMVKTKMGFKLIERLSVYKRFWRAFGVFSNVISFILMAFIVLVIAVGVLNISASLAAPGIGVDKALAIPGINPLLPFWYGWFGLVVAMVIHELAHGFQTRANGMRVNSTGALYGVVPLGAFVEPNEEDIEKSSRRAKLDLYSAGITMNFIGAAVAFLIFAVVLMGGISSSYGDNAGVYRISSDSPADHAGIPDGAIILSVDGQPYCYDSTNTFSFDPGSIVTIEYLTKDHQDIPLTKNIQWGVYIERITDNSPANNVLETNTFIRSVTIDGNKTPIHDVTEFLNFMKTTKPGETAAIECVTVADEDGNFSTFDKELTLSDNGGIGYIGVSTSTSGMGFITPDAMLEIGRNPIYGAEGIRGTTNALLSYIAGPVNGYSPIPSSTQWWYDVPLGGSFWIIVSILYWIFWLNVMLGVSNAIPAIPFDGGFMFQGWFSGLLQRLGLKDEKRREETVSRVTSALSMVMIFLLILVIAAVAL